MQEYVSSALSASESGDPLCKARAESTSECRPQMEEPAHHLRVPLNFEAPCVQQIQWYVFLILVLSHPLLELN
jgi:hypothetical protein